MGSLGPNNKPLSPCPPELDCKWRFFWRIGKPPLSSKFPQLNMDPVIPPEIPEWEDVMNSWGGRMLNALEVAAEMSATGFGLPSDAFTKLMDGGPHLLAPTGTDLGKYGAQFTVQVQTQTNPPCLFIFVCAFYSEYVLIISLLLSLNCD
jgi:hypothetical protein